MDSLVTYLLDFNIKTSESFTEILEDFDERFEDKIDDELYEYFRHQLITYLKNNKK